MARNLSFQILRGIEANIPALNLGEMYYATDTGNLWIGGNNGNQFLGGSSAPVQFILPSSDFQIKIDTLPGVF